MGVVAHPQHVDIAATHKVLTGQLVRGEGQSHVVAIGQQPWGGWDLSQCLWVLEVPGGCSGEGTDRWGWQAGEARPSLPQSLAAPKASSPARSSMPQWSEGPYRHKAGFVTLSKYPLAKAQLSIHSQCRSQGGSPGPWSSQPRGSPPAHTCTVTHRC